jgi:hypothetical protein
MKKSAGPENFDGDAVLSRIASLAESNELPVSFTIVPSSSDSSVIVTEQSNGKSLGSRTMDMEPTTHGSAWAGEGWRSRCNAEQLAMLTKGLRSIVARKVGQVYFISVVVAEKFVNVAVRYSPPKPGAHKTFVIDQSGSIVRIIGGR